MLKLQVEILLATYNGAVHIGELLESLTKQSYQSFRVLCHDDGSIDRTVEILKSWRDSCRLKIEIIEDEYKFGCPARNFMHLLAKSKADYVLFCDQDDYWRPEKVRISVETLDAITKVKSGPTLVFSDLEVVDKNLNIVAKSFLSQQRKWNHVHRSLKYLMVDNPAAGCTIAMNSAARSVCLRKKNIMKMHDWWCVLAVKAASGVVFRLERSTVLYRQHSQNEIGAPPQGILDKIKKLTRLGQILCSYRDQARSFDCMVTPLCLLWRKIIVYSRVLSVGTFCRSK